MLKHLNPHKNDCLISFDPIPHIYNNLSNNSQFHSSVTSFVKRFFPSFESKQDGILKSLVAKNFNNKSSKYFQLNEQQIKDLWNVDKISAASKGTLLHASIEYYFNDQSHLINPDILSSTEWSYFLNFLSFNKHLTPYRTEWEIFDPDADLAGSIDMVFKDSSGLFHIYDWKRSKEIKLFSFNNESALDPINHIPNSNYWHYALQLNIYKYILQKNYDIIIDKLHIVVFHENFNNFLDYELPCLQNEVKSMMNF